MSLRRFAQVITTFHTSIRSRIREWGGRKADLAVCFVEYVVKALEEGEAVDEVHTPATGRLEVVHN